MMDDSTKAWVQYTHDIHESKHQDLEVRNQDLEAKNQRLEAKNQRLEAKNRKLKTDRDVLLKVAQVHSGFLDAYARDLSRRNSASRVFGNHSHTLGNPHILGNAVEKGAPS